MKSLLIILFVGVFATGCMEKEPSSIIGRYQVNRIEDGVLDTSRTWIWQIDSSFFAYYHEDTTLASAQVYFVRGDTIMFGQAYELEGTGEFEFDTTGWPMAFKLGENGIDTLEDGSGKFVLKKIGTPIGPYYDTTEITDANVIRDKLNGSWASYTNPLGKEHNEKFSYVRFEFQKNKLIQTFNSGNENLDHTIRKYSYHIVKEDELVLIPEKFYFDGAAWIKGNSHYKEEKYTIDIADSSMVVEYHGSKGVLKLKRE